VGLALLLTLLTGAAITLYNVYLYEVLSPFPLSWVRDPADLELVELLRAREALALRVASARRIGSASGLALLASESPSAEVEAELAILDQKIAVLRAKLAARRGAPGTTP
jgi:hypothetical protein